jgi:hypothetical protein
MNFHVESQGWFSLKQVASLCVNCVWRMVEHRMTACEYGQPQFPAAKKCPKFTEDK